VTFEPVLIGPEEERAEAYPYRRVWRTAWLEATALFLVAFALYALTNIAGVVSSRPASTTGRTAIAALPVLLWLTISYRSERRAIQPRPALLRVMILGALVASGVAIPLEEHLFQPERWLPGLDFFGRLLGYATTVGFAAEFLKYLVLRYSVWPQHINQRLDGVAYGLAVSVGFATVFSLRFALFTEATLSATALRMTGITLLHLATGAIVGFFLAELWVGRTAILWLPVGLTLAALVSGAHYAFRAIAIVGSPGVESTGSSPLLGLLLTAGFAAAAFSLFAFIIASADTRAALALHRHLP
jgi:RsiW-degrading membrane proteinase PrsW (M82 family)